MNTTFLRAFAMCRTLRLRRYLLDLQICYYRMQCEDVAAQFRRGRAKLRLKFWLRVEDIIEWMAVRLVLFCRWVARKTDAARF